MAGFGDPDFFRSILENLHMAVYVVGRDGRILFWNDGAERITGYLCQDVIGRVCGENFLGETDGGESDANGALTPIAAATRDRQPLQAQVSLRHKSGHRIPVQLWAFPIRNAQGVIVGAAETFEETISVADWDRRQNKLATYGCIDHASGVLNHGMMHAHFREHLGMFAEHPVPFSVLCIHIGGLEKIQLRDGPAAIAAVLRVVGQILENSLRPTAFLGRCQENQFFAILTECSGSEIARASERLRRMVSASKIAWGDRLPVTVSVGGTVVKSGDTVEGMVTRAERALRESISQGGNRPTTRDGMKAGKNLRGSSLCS
jgi:PAS domain S-box-containing protein/diguanylate cyclase (GGDEF)-like protein